MICQICGKTVKGYRGLGIHSARSHNISKEQYFLKFLGEKGICHTCGSPTKFKSLSYGYHSYCSTKCMANSQNIKHSRKRTCLYRYNVDNPSKVQDFEEKKKRTCYKHFGVDNPSKSPQIQRKKIETSLSRYGETHHLRNAEIVQKQTNTCLQKYGVKNVSQSDLVRLTKLSNYFQRLVYSNRLKEKCIPLFEWEDYGGVSNKYPWKCVKCEAAFEDHLDNGHIPRCPICYPSLGGTSIYEKEIVEFLKELNVICISNDRSILNGKELDIYIPSHNLAIEFNGCYWHSELNGKDKNYHLNKTIECQKQGIQLIHIFEDEWIDKQEIVKSIIRSRLELIQERICARKCQCLPVSNKDSQLFLFNNHLQGPINGNHFGLYYNEELVSILSYGKPRFDNNYQIEILRYCSKLDTIVVGGLSNLMKNLNSKLGSSVITYVDRRFGEGLSYLECGFLHKGFSVPSFFYLKGYKRFLESKLETFDPNLTEWQNMQLSGYDRIWDCGCNVFSMNI